VRISVLWSKLASYSVAFFRELACSQKCDIQLVFWGSSAEAPYKGFDLSFCSRTINRSERCDIDIEKEVCDFSPDCVLMSSWNFGDYMKIARRLRKKGVFVVSTIDHQWHGTMKQWLGVVFSRWFLKPSIDSFLVAGDRQAYFAQKLGFEHVLYGLYAATVEDFKTTRALLDREPSFLFVGRLTFEKGIEILIAAYHMYRQECEFPWDLKIAGVGNLRYLLNDKPGVKELGFVQPADLPDLMRTARALVCPSIREPWGVVIHEGAAAGLPIIATNSCGATSSFVRDGINGIIVPPNPNALKNAMLRMSRFNADELENLGQASQTLARLWSSNKLAHYFVENIKIRINHI
jgi:glycosyltransferase involved in cell wall biosynthesis